MSSLDNDDAMSDDECILMIGPTVNPASYRDKKSISASVVVVHLQYKNKFHHRFRASGLFTKKTIPSIRPFANPKVCDMAMTVLNVDDATPGILITQFAIIILGTHVINSVKGYTYNVLTMPNIISEVLFLYFK